MRALAKRGIEWALEAGGVASVRRRALGGRDLVLAYHGIVPDALVRRDASGHIGASRFAAQMEALATLAEVVPVAALAAPARQHERPRVAITFDDGYVGAFRHGVPVLRRLGLPATFFVCPTLLGGEPFWWDAPGLDVWARAAELLTGLQGRRERVMDRIAAHRAALDALPGDVRPAGLDVVLRAAQEPGISIGSHTMRHPNLAALPEAEVREELSGARAWLAERVPGSLAWVAYPFGLANATVQRVARACGYEGAFVLDGGWIPAHGADRYALPRLNVSAGVSVRGFRLRLADIFAR